MKSEIKISGNRLQITRVFDAPRESVFRWWTQAETLQQWSGCKDATRCEVEMDFRVGGSFKQTMQIAGADKPFTINGTYEEIVVPEKIRYRLDMGMAVTDVLIEFSRRARARRSSSRRTDSRMRSHARSSRTERTNPSTNSIPYCP